jgi:hypothetical protein
VKGKQKSPRVLLLLVFLGLILGSALGRGIGHLLPEGVVKRFFLESVTASLGPATLDLVAFALTLGFSLTINVLAILGVIFAVYLFRWY